MPESAVHLALVQSLVQWVKSNCLIEKDGLLLVDDPAQMASSKPPSINGYFPDVYLRGLRLRSILIGEAKSAYDLESRHSRKQLASFLIHLLSVERGTLLVAVPWHVVPRAKSLIRAIQRETNSMSVQTIFLDYLPG